MSLVSNPVYILNLHIFSSRKSFRTHKRFQKPIAVSERGLPVPGCVVEYPHYTGARSEVALSMVGRWLPPPGAQCWQLPPPNATTTLIDLLKLNTNQQWAACERTLLHGDMILSLSIIKLLLNFPPIFSHLIPEEGEAFQLRQLWTWTLQDKFMRFGHWVDSVLYDPG